MSNRDFRIFLVHEHEGKVLMIGRIIGTATAVTAEVYHHHAWHYDAGLNVYLDEPNPDLYTEIDESDMPAYMKQMDKQNDEQ